jgi:cell division protease FtsH
MPAKDPSPQPAHREQQPPKNRPLGPWRTEGLPPPQSPKQRLGWAIWAICFVAFLILFCLLTLQERMAGPQSISYTEFKTQVANKNVSEVFSRGETIEGTLRKPAKVPQGSAAKGQQQRKTYQTFTTVRPAFASDNLLSELMASGATVRATPLVEKRGILINLLISFAPFLLLILFYVWMFRRHSALGSGVLGRGPRMPVNPGTVRATFEDVAGIDEVKAEIYEVVDFLEAPAKYQRLGARVPKGVLLSGAPGTGKALLARATAGEANVPFSAPALRSLSRSSWALAPAAFANSSQRLAKWPRRSSSLTKSRPLDVLVWDPIPSADMMSASRR